jgi:hypothetical protein
MPAVAPYIPSKEADLDAWAANFSTLISAAPAMYGLALSDAGTIAAMFANWHSAYVLTTSNTTKTAATVAAKNTQKVNMLGVIRPYAQMIALNPGVSSANKIALGLNPRTSTPSPITPPASNPILNVQSAANLSIILRYRDSAASVSVKAKPYGVTVCQVFFLVSTTPVTDPTTMLLMSSATKSPLTATFPSTKGGQQAYFAARWVTQSGGVSPWSPIVSFTIPMGS